MKQKSSLKDRLVGSRYFSFGITLSLFVLLYVVGMMNYRGFMKPQVFCNLLDNAAKHGGAGTLVPITGFANAIVSPAMEFKSEGYVMGIGAKMFSIAGPVLVYGTCASIIYGLIIFLFKMY